MKITACPVLAGEPRNVRRHVVESHLGQDAFIVLLGLPLRQRRSLLHDTLLVGVVHRRLKVEQAPCFLLATLPG